LRRPYALAALLITAIAVLIVLDALQTGQGPSGPTYEKAPDFTLADIYGEEFSLSRFRGKVVLLDFFATWCEPCKQEIPELKRLKSRFGGQLVIISISISPGDTDEVLREFAEQHGMDWLVARDTAGVADLYDVKALPTLVLVDKSGFIRFRHEGLTSYETLEREVREILGS